MADGIAEDLNRETLAAKALQQQIVAEFGEDDPELAKDMIEGSTSFFELFDRVFELFQKDGELIAGIQARKRELKLREERVKHRQGHFKAMMEQALVIFGKKLERPEATISSRKGSQKVLVTEEADVPAKYWKPGDPTLDREQLLADLKAGETIPGCALETGPTSISIRKV